MLLIQMPRVAKKGLDISLRNDILSIKGIKADKAPADWSCVHCEREIDDYALQLRLNKVVDRDKDRSRYARRGTTPEASFP